MKILDRRSPQTSLPTLRANPALQPLLPVRPLRVYAPRKLECGRIELEGRKIAKLIPVRIEKLIVINFVVLPENPLATRIQVCLRRLAFNLVAERILPLVGSRQIELIKEK